MEPCFHNGFGQRAVFSDHLSLYSLQALRLTSWFPFPKSLSPLYPYQSQICLPGLHLRPFILKSSSLVATCSYFNLSPVRGRDSYCSQCSHWQLLPLFMFPQRAFIIWCRFLTTCTVEGEDIQYRSMTRPQKSPYNTNICHTFEENHPVTLTSLGPF